MHFRPSWEKTLRFYLQMIFAWISAINLFLFFREYGVEAIINKPNMDLPGILLINIASGIIAGILFASMELIFETPFYRRFSYKRLFFKKAIVYFLFINTILAIALTLLYFISPAYNSLTEVFIEFGRSKSYWVIVIYFQLVIMAISFLRQIDQKFGPGILWDMIKGKYYHPKEDHRIFMFLDLKSSTTIAEKLGHLKFSQLIQDCFFDLNEIVNDYHANIYQYVGDEAVLHWGLESGFTNNNCIQIYFAFKEKLESKSEYYLNKYDLIPEFKAGVHGGKVMIAEVGAVKKEIAFHGDVLNTASRIQGECKRFGYHIIVSDKIQSELEQNGFYQGNALGEVLLRGKTQKINLFGIAPIVNI